MPLMGSVLTVNNLGDTGTAGDLRYAIAHASNGDSIVFTVSGLILLNSPLNIGTSLTILGTGIAIDGSTSGTIFSLTGSTSDTFSELTLLSATVAIAGSPTAFVSVLNSTISGGQYGLQNINATVTNSTFGGNTAAISGGTVTLYDSTISGGTTGVENANLTSGNSIIAGNATDLGSGTVGTSLGHNLIGNIGSGTGFTNGVNGDQVGTGASPIDPLLSSLANNGGPAPTFALLLGSSAIDAGDNGIIPSGVTSDQRGPGFARISGNGTVDIGAFEYQTPEPATYVTYLLGLALGAFRLRKR
jgi:hypothetical protein